jgi:hypothetical protein
VIITFENLQHARALAHEAVEAALGAELALQLAVLVLQPLPLERVRDRQLQLIELEGLGHVVVGTELHGLHGRLGGRERRDDQDDRSGRVLLGGLEDGQTVDLPHTKIGDHEVETIRALQHFDGRLAAIGLRHVIAGLLEHDSEELAHTLLVVDDEDARVSHGESESGG